MTKLRGTEAEIYARLRELTEEFRQLRRELAGTTLRRAAIKGFGNEKPDSPSLPSRPTKPKRR